MFETSHFGKDLIRSFVFPIKKSIFQHYSFFTQAMSSQNLSPLIAAICLLLACSACQQTNPSTTFPKPTEVHPFGEDGDNASKREAWLRLMHQTAPGDSWKNIEYQNQLRLHQRRKNQSFSRNGEESLADGNLVGSWKERGSSNQAGSVFVTDYDEGMDMLWLISAGGTLFSGPLTGNDWTVVQQDFRFDNQLLKVWPTANGGRRIVASIAGTPHYSDDLGVSWEAASIGITYSDDRQRIQQAVVIEAGLPEIYILTKSSYWDPLRLFRSTDYGETYQEILNLGNHDNRDYALCHPHHSDQLLLLERSNNGQHRLYEIEDDSSPLALLHEFTGVNIDRANLIGYTHTAGNTDLYVYSEGSGVYLSQDLGASWQLQSILPFQPWSVGLFVSPSNPNHLMAGAVECAISKDQGETWEIVNNWWEYYDDVNGALHADMMWFSEFEDTAGNPFLLSSNHGGLNITYDEWETISNLGLESLNVSQYYDVRSHPDDPDFIYAGSQDQGFQRGSSSNPDEIIPFEQVISGDYGHIRFSQNGQRLWTVYPGGWITYYANPKNGGYLASFEIESENETVWIPPVMSSPDPAENAVYMAGGSVDGGSGSYLIKLTYQSGEILSEQLPTDFYAESGFSGTISAMTFSPLNTDRWYVGTTSGRFFTSNDGGQTWDQTIETLPGGQYLYGASIFASQLDPETVYYAGSGYSNPAVFKSTNGGITFNAMNNGLPPTLVYELTANEEETLFFAGTEAGPYVYVVEEDQWYPMLGTSAPIQSYWSVEYLSEEKIVRFGTYGRGIWDFVINENPVNTVEVAAPLEMKVMPNPAVDYVDISLTDVQVGSATLQWFSLDGRLIQSEVIQISGAEQSVRVMTPMESKGINIIQVRQGNQVWNQRVMVK